MIIRCREIQKALENGLYNCALALSLTLPDICGKVEYPKERAGNRYAKWFKKFVEPLFTQDALCLPGEYSEKCTWFTADECWQLRCAYLHSGNYEVEHLNLKNLTLHVHLRDGQNYNTCIRDGESADFDIIEICTKICNAAENYYLSIENKNLFYVDEIRIDTW